MIQSMEVDALRLEKKQLTSRLAEVDKKIEKFSRVEPISGWKERVFDCVIKHNRVCRTIEILECMLGSDKTLLENDIIKANYIKNVTASLIILQREKRIKSVTGEKGKYFYGMPDWIEGKEVKKKYAAPKVLTN